MQFDGNFSYLETPLKTSDLPDTFTVECWVKPDASQNLYADIFGNHCGETANNTAGGFVMQQDGANSNRYAAAYGAGGTWVATTPMALTADEWQHVAIVKSKETLSFYLNGEEAASVPAPDPMVPSPIPLRIGMGYPATDRIFRGCIDEFRVWNRAIPPK
jgi:hypothetical protein